MTKLDSCLEYYENGQIKHEGIMTNPHHVHIGIWNYYSEKGKLDSTVNFDKKYKILYFKALEIARKNGYEMPDTEVNVIEDKEKTYWQIIHWTAYYNNGKSGDAILIDTKSGSVSKSPDKVRAPN